ncbi:MAG: hypothetical protein ACK4IY_04335 [Chitinophagales bacterium]
MIREYHPLKIQTAASSVLLIAVPFFVVYSYLFLTDSIADRPQNPYGYTIHKASINTVFVPPGSLADALIPGSVYAPPIQAEGYAYIGVVTLFVLTGFFLWCICLQIWKKENTAWNNLPPLLMYYLLAGICILLFAMAWPFVWGLEDWLEKIPFIRQFRSPGRFAWVFYFISTVCAAVIIYHLFDYLHVRRKVFAWFFLVCIASVGIYESATYFFSMAKKYDNDPVPNSFTAKNGNAFTSLNTIDLKGYQAILYVPFFMQGSEKFYIDRSGNEISTAMAIAYQSKLPLINSMMSRTSFSQTVSLISLLSHPLLQKIVPGELNDKPLLLVTSNNNLSAAEKYLVNNAQLIESSGDLQFYTLPISVFSTAQSMLTQGYLQFIEKMFADSTARYFAELPLQLFYTADFEDYHTGKAFTGNGAFVHTGGGIFLDEIILPAHETFWIEVSFWTSLENANTAYPSITIEFLLADGTTMAAHGVHPKESTDIEAGWIRASGNFEVRSDIRRLRIFVDKNPEITFDALVIRHTAADVFYYSPENLLMENNYKVGK